MVTRNQNYSFIEKDPLLFNSAKILALLNNKGSCSINEWFLIRVTISSLIINILKVIIYIDNYEYIILTVNIIY